MTAAVLLSLRNGLGLNAHAFAEILGVHVSTIYRWEATRGHIPMDPMQQRILEQLETSLKAKRVAEQKAMGEEIKNALLVGGALFALYILLKNTNVGKAG